jgi:uncharacterized protein (TIRG00374 family)
MQPVHEIVNETALKFVAPALPRPVSGMDHLFKKLLVFIPIGIIGNILFFFLAGDNNLLRSVAHFSPVYIVMAMVLSVVPWFTGSLRLFLWSRFVKGNIRYQDTFKIVISAELGAAISPPMIGGNAVKIGMLMRQGFSGGAAMSLTLLENLEDCIFFICMVPIALTMSSSWNLPIVKSVIGRIEHAPLWGMLGALCVIACIIVVVARQSEGLLQRFPLVRTFTDRVKASYKNFSATYHSIIREGKGMLALTMLLTSLQWICRYSVVTLVFMSLGIATQPVLFMALQVIVFALMTFVPTPGGAGGAEAMFSLLYRTLVPEGAIGVVTTCWRFLTFYFLLLLASLLFLLFNMHQGTAIKKVQNESALL